LSPQRLCLTALVALCGAVASADAENLFLLRSGADEVVLLDRDSVVRRGGRAQAWVVERKEVPGRPASEVRRLYLFDCATRTLSVAQRSGAAGAGTGNPVTAPAGTALEQTLLAYACGR
jgi:hypothetical protein